MKLAQIVPSFSPGDAVSNSAWNLGEVLRGLGIENRVYAEHLHPAAHQEILPFKKFNPTEWDAVIYHFAIESDVAEEMTLWQGLKRYILYHNVTPSHYFRGYDENSREACKNAREQLYMLKDHVDAAFAVSNYNAAELHAIGYKQVELLPLWFDSKLDQVESEPSLLRKLQDGWTNLLFVGRITPHKCQHDLIKVFYIYKKYINPKSRLIFVGSGMDKYLSELRSSIQTLGLQDVIFPGHISERQLATYYRTASVFLSMSEHEGFCVPLLEAMNFRIPIVAFEAAAIGETLGSSGIKLQTKDPQFTAELLSELMENSAMQDALIDQQTLRLQDFQVETVRLQIISSFGKVGLLTHAAAENL